MSDEDEAHRRAGILEGMSQEPVDWKDFREVIQNSEEWDPIKWPDDHDWFLIKDVPMDAFRGIDVDAIADVEDPDERREHRERYKLILSMLKKGAKPWPVIVASTGMIIDGFHRLAAFHKLRRRSVDVLFVPV